MEGVGGIIASGSLRAVYQPIVNLQTGDTVAYEALARGPAGSTLERPDALFSAARDEGLLDDLDWACRLTALRGALELGMANPAALFINVEPAALHASIPEDQVDFVARSADEMRLVAEFTERTLASRPALLLQAATGVRALGAGVAVDDVGAHERSLGLLPFLRPDVVKLDLSIVQGAVSPHVTGVAHAVSAHTERTGARVLAEGIETEEHLSRALALGATLGQGWYFGRPEPLPEALPPVRPWAAVPLLAATPMPRQSQTPFEVLHGARQILEADVGILLAMSRDLERGAMDLGARGVVLASLQHARRVTPSTVERYRRLAANGAFTGLVAEGISKLGLDDLTTGDLNPRDRLRREWSVTVLGPHYSAGFAARELDGTSPRRFAFALTHNRELVVRMAAALFGRLDASTEGAEL